MIDSQNGIVIDRMQNRLHKLQRDLNDAYQHLKQGTDPNLVVKQLSQLQRKWPNQLDVIHLLALALKQAGEFDKAEQQFNLALSIDPNHVQVLNNLANLLKEQNKLELAVDTYLRALKLQPNFPDARKNLGLCYLQIEDYQRAISSLSKVLELNPNDVSARTALANALRDTGEHQAAELQYQAALSVNNNYINAWHNRGVNFHLIQNNESAAQCYQAALNLNPKLEESALSYSLLLKEGNDLPNATSILKSALVGFPDSLRLQKQLNEFLWEAGDHQQFVENIDRALNGHISDQHKSELIAQLISSGRINEAQVYVDNALKQSTSNELLKLKGQLLAEKGELIEAFELFDDRLKLSFDQHIATEQVKLSIIIEEYSAAQAQLDKLFQVKPNCQLTWALQGLLWRFTEPKKYQWLHQAYDFVKGFDLPVPDGYSNRDDFLKAVTECLLNLHQTNTQPLEQTLRNGTQTAAKLLDRNEPELVLLRQSIESVIGEYISQLPIDNDHPFLARITGDFKISGSWSVRLKPNGFHVNHVHPAGWISSASYLHIPSSMELEEDSQEGAIKFGESPLSLGDREVIEKLIKPRPGMLVLFPSFTWHGTIPFSGDDKSFRLTAPFDVVPA